MSYLHEVKHANVSEKSRQHKATKVKGQEKTSLSETSNKQDGK